MSGEGQTQDPEQDAAPEFGSRGPAVARALLSKLRALALAPLLALVLGFAGFAQPVQADPGSTSGWDLQQASAERQVGRVTFRYDPSLEAEADELISKLPQWWSELEQALAHDLDDTMTIHFVTHAGQVARSTGMPEWVKGVANTGRGEIAVSFHSPDGSISDFGTTLRHEMAHVALYRAAGNRPLPRWFQEGVAESLTEEVSFGRAEALATAIFGAGVPELAKIDEAFHGDQRETGVAYAAARDFVGFLRFYDGEGHLFRRVLTELRNGHGFEASFLRAYDFTLEELDAQWREGLVGRFVWYPLFASGTLPFLLFVPVGAVAWVRKRREFRRGLERLAAEDLIEEEKRAEALRRAGLSPHHWN